MAIYQQSSFFCHESSPFQCVFYIEYIEKELCLEVMF